MLDVKLSERAERHGGEMKVNEVKLKRHTLQHANKPGNLSVWKHWIKVPNFTSTEVTCRAHFDKSGFKNADVSC